jgi:hypothetical protein
MFFSEWIRIRIRVNSWIRIWIRIKVKIHKCGKWEGVGHWKCFLGPKWHSPIGSMPFQRTQKTLDFQGPTPSPLPS